MKRKFLIFLLVTTSMSTISQLALAQNEDDIIRFLQAGQEDGSKMITAYINPFVEGLSYSLNGAWFHTARPHKLGGFDLNVAVTPVFIPTSQDTFDPLSLGLTTVTGFTNLTNADRGAPTITGKDDETRYFINVDLDADGNVNSPGNPQNDPNDSFTGPEGLNLRETIKIAPIGSPMLQVGIGLVKNTDIMVRFVPKSTLGSTSAKLLGFGVRHDIKQHIAGLKMVPIDLSLMAGYTQLTIDTDLSGIASEFPPVTPGTAQKAEMTMNAFLIQALVSKQLSFITFFGGVGYNGIKTSADIKGSYTFFDGRQDEFTLTDPYSANFKNNSFRFDVGMRFNILAFYLYGNYTIQEYSAVTAGLGFTFR